MTVLFAQAVGKGLSSNPFTLTEDTLVVVTGAVNATGAAMALSMKKADDTYVRFGKLRAPDASGILPKGTYIATRLGDASLGLETSAT